MTSTITPRRSVLALAASLSTAGLLAGCNAFSSTTPASLAAEPTPVGNFVSTTQPIRDFAPSVAYYPNGDTASGSTGIRYVSGLGYTGGSTGPAGGYGYVGANNAAGGAGAASGVGAGGLAGSSDTGFTAGTPVASGTGTAGAGLTGNVNTPTGTGTPTVGTPAGTDAATANQTAAANAAGVNAGVGSGSGGIVDRGVATNAETLNNANDAAAISNSNASSGAGTAVGSGAGAGTIGGTDSTGRTGIDPAGVIISSGGSGNTNAIGGVNTSPGAGSQAAPTQSFAQRAETAGLIATTPAVGTGLFAANVVTAPYTLWEQRSGIVSSGVQFPPTYTAMPALPPSPANSPVNPEDRVVPIRGTTPGETPPAVSIGTDATGTPTTSPIRPAILKPVLEGETSATAFTIAGDVPFPGRYETGTDVTLSEAIAGAGLEASLEPSKVKFRLERPGSETAEATLADLQSDKVNDIVLKPGDTLTLDVAPRPIVEPATNPQR